MAIHESQVGAPDPELRTSPIFEEYEDASLDLELETGACYFHNTFYPLGQYLLSGSELVYCELRGVSVRRGDMRPE